MSSAACCSKEGMTGKSGQWQHTGLRTVCRPLTLHAPLMQQKQQQQQQQQQQRRRSLHKRQQAVPHRAWHV